jgi:hypothetical protein
MEACVLILPSVIAALSSLRNGHLLNGTKKQVSDLQNKSLLTRSDNICEDDSHENDTRREEMPRRVPRTRPKGKSKKSAITKEKSLWEE